MYRRLLSIIAIGLSVSACVPYYSGSSGYYRSEVYSAPAPEYYGGGYRSYYVYPRAVYAPPPRYYHGPRYYPSQQAYQGPRYYQPPRGYHRDRGYRPDHRPGYGPGPGNGWRGR
nr:hypothetical protein [Pseudomonas psychrophila]